MKSVLWLSFTLSLLTLLHDDFIDKSRSSFYFVQKHVTRDKLVPTAACDSITIFLQQLHTAPPSCCFQLIIDNKLRNAITQIKLDIGTATFTNIVTVAGWVVSQTLQKDILLSNNSGFIPLGNSSPLTFCLMGGNNPDSLKISFNYSALGTAGSCNINTLICSDPLPCSSAFSFQGIGSCGNFQFTNNSTGPPPLLYSWNFGDPASGASNLSSTQNPTHQFTACGNYNVCLKTTGSSCKDSICKTVTFNDNVKPVITCPANLTLRCNNNFNPPATGFATATDNCTSTNAIAITFSDVVTGTMPCNGTIIRSWQAKDACANISTCVQTINIQDNVVPSIVCPTNTIVNTNPGVCFYTGNIPTATATDNCDQSLDITSSLLTVNSSILITSQTQFPKGVNTITCFAKDDCGNQSQNCNFTLTVIDNQAPAISCPNSISVIGTLNPQGLCKAIVNNIPPTVSDNCTMLSTSFSVTGMTIISGSNDASGTNFMLGLSTVTYTTTDMGGNSKACSFNISVSCPPPPRPKCDSVSASITPQVFPASPFACLFGLTINNQASSISKIQIDLKTATFGGAGVNLPFTGINFTGTSLTLIPSSGNSIAIGSFIATSFSVIGGTNPDTLVVKFFYNNGLSSCDTNIIFNCPVPPPPRPKCDSISASMLPFSGLPYFCSFQILVNNQATNITKVQIDLKTAYMFSAGNVFPFSPLITNNNSRITITHPSGTIPIGNFHIVDIDVSSGSNPDTALVKFFYNNGQSSCDTNIIFNCPVDTTCGYPPSCATTNISLNTGVDVNGQLLSPGTNDPNWTIINSPYTNINLPRPAEVIQKYASWDFQPNAVSSCAQWISVFQGANYPNNVSYLQPYSYQRCFCVCKDKSTIKIQLSALADNNAKFSLYDAIGNFISPLLTVSYISTPYLAFQLPPDTSTTTLILNKGTYCIRADVRNYANVTGINVCGSVSGQGLIKAECCESQSYVTGHKYLDQLCNGLPYTNQTLLPGWQIVLCNASGIAIDTSITDANGTYIFGPIPAGNYSIKEINKPGWTLKNPSSNIVQVHLGTHEVQQFNFGNCPPSSCDSISFWVESLKTIPPGCCFRLHVDNKAQNKFLPIQLDLHSANFNSITVDNLGGWFNGQANQSNLVLSHNSNFIPVGSFTPISWCVNNGSNPDTISIKAQYLVGQNIVNCDTSFVFFCPPQPDTTCGIQCKADSISLSTGVDHSTGQFYTAGSPDAYWTVIHSPYPLYILPKPAFALTTPGYWHDQPNAAMPCSRWINFSGGPYHYDQGLYEFTRCFCICKDGASISIHLSALADNSVSFTLCDSNGTTVANLLSTTSGYPFLNPPKDTTVQLILNKGKYCIKASVYNGGHTYTGLNVCGSIKGDGLVKEICCEPSSIKGIKYVDTTCVGMAYNGSQQTLQGWQIVLCNSQGMAIDTVTTDIAGSYNFSNLLPGLYTVKEINQSGWTPSLPANGMSSIFVGANQVVQVNFGNCPPEIDSCCKSKTTFIQNISNAIHLEVIDSLCKAKITVPRLPACDSIFLINWGDGHVTNGPFTSGMWMHTYTQSGTYTIQIPIVEINSNGKACFDTLLKYTIDVHCTCDCGKYGLMFSQNGLTSNVKCSDTVRLGCPAPKSLFIQSTFACVGDSCGGTLFQWSIIGPGINLSGSLISNVIIQFNIPPLSPGFTTLNIQTTCGQVKCNCKVTFSQPSCTVSDSCGTYCNGTSWNQLNTSWIQDMLVFQGKLIVAGQFTSIGNPSVSANHIAAWNGTTWSPMGTGFNNIVNDIEVHNGKLYAGGEFTTASGNPVNKIAEWNGTTWTNLFQGGVNGIVTNVDALYSTSAGLVVGGRFTSVGTSAIPGQNIALWNPSPGGWSFMGTLNGPVFTVSSYNNQIIAGGQFGNSPGGLNNIGSWNGSVWNKLGQWGAIKINTSVPVTGDGVHAFATLPNGDLVAGGQYLNAIDNVGNAVTSTQHLAKWNGANWSSLGGSVNTGIGIYDLLTVGNDLLAGGKFTQIGNQNINLLAKWNGTAWSGFGHPSIGIVKAIAMYSPNKDSLCNLYTGGEVIFNQWKCSGVSTHDQTKSISVTIYPNPAKEKINIQFNEDIHDDVHIALYSLVGRLISYHTFSRAEQTKVIDIESIPSASYFIKVSTGKGAIVKKIIIAR